MPDSIIFDVDGVLLNYHGSFCRYYNIREQTSKYDFSDLGIQQKTLYSMITEFAGTEEFEKIEPYPDAVELVTKLAEERVPMSILTNSGSKKRRISNLVNAFGDVFSDIEVFPLFDAEGPWKKYAGLANLSPCVFVDDMPEYANFAFSIGHTTLFREHHYNSSSVVNPPRINSLMDPRILEALGVPRTKKTWTPEADRLREHFLMHGLKEDFVSSYFAVAEDMREDTHAAIAWAEQALTELEGEGHRIIVSATVGSGVVCSFAKPEWSGGYCGPGMGTGSEAIVAAVVSYKLGY